MKLRKSSMGVVAGATLFGVVMPTSNVVTQAVSLKGIKQSFVSLFMRTFYFWYYKGTIINELKEKLEVNKENLLEQIRKKIADSENLIKEAFFYLSYDDEVVFSDKGELDEKSAKFLKEKKESIDKEYYLLDAQDSSANFLYGCFKVLNAFEDLRNACHEKKESRCKDILRNSKKVFKGFFEGFFTTSEKEDRLLFEKLVDEDLFKKINLNEFSELLEEKLIVKLREKLEKNELFNNYVKGKFDGSLYYVKNLKKLLIDTENSFNAARKKLENFTASHCLHVRKIIAKKEFLDSCREKLDFLNNLYLNPNYYFRKPNKPEHEFNLLFKKLNELRKNWFYYGGNLGIFDKQ